VDHVPAKYTLISRKSEEYDRTDYGSTSVIIKMGGSR